jgi:hypothetical protein
MSCSLKSLFVACVLAGMACSGSPVITTNASCSASGFKSVSDPGYCTLGTPPSSDHVNGVYSGSAAEAYLSPLGAGSSTGWITATLYGSVRAQFDPNVPRSGAAAMSMETITADLASAGPVRPGYLEGLLSFSGGGTSSDYYEGTSYELGSIQGGCGGSYGICFGPRVPGPFPFIVPFTLGTTFTLRVSSGLLAATTIDTAVASGDANFTFEFRLLDSNVMPVQVFNAPPVPEPGTFGTEFCCLGCLVAAWRTARRQRRQHARGQS